MCVVLFCQFFILGSGRLDTTACLQKTCFKLRENATETFEMLRVYCGDHNIERTEVIK
jgi:hypothetical protein